MFSPQAVRAPGVSNEWRLGGQGIVNVNDLAALFPLVGCAA
jgi:hypothetical protein